MLKDLKTKGILGHTVATLHIIEFQKRVTAHAYTTYFGKGRQDTMSRGY